MHNTSIEIFFRERERERERERSFFARWILVALNREAVPNKLRSPTKNNKKIPPQGASFTVDFSRSDPTNFKSSCFPRANSTFLSVESCKEYAWKFKVSTTTTPFRRSNDQSNERVSHSTNNFSAFLW